MPVSHFLNLLLTDKENKPKLSVYVTQLMFCSVIINFLISAQDVVKPSHTEIATYVGFYSGSV